MGQMFGEEDVICDRKYTTTVTCKSKTGDLFCIPNSDFVRRLKALPDSWKIVVLMAMAKDKAIHMRVKRIKEIIAENKISINKKPSFLRNCENSSFDLREIIMKIINSDPKFEN